MLPRKELNLVWYQNRNLHLTPHLLTSVMPFDLSYAILIFLSLTIVPSNGVPVSPIQHHPRCAASSSRSQTKTPLSTQNVCFKQVFEERIPTFKSIDLRTSGNCYRRVQPDLGKAKYFNYKDGDEVVMYFPKQSASLFRRKQEDAFANLYIHCQSLNNVEAKTVICGAYRAAMI